MKVNIESWRGNELSYAAWPSDYASFAQALSDYSPFGPNRGTYAQCDGSEIHPWGLLSYSPCMSLAETCIVLEHCPDAKEHDDLAWEYDLAWLDCQPLILDDNTL